MKPKNPRLRFCFHRGHVGHRPRWIASALVGLALVIAPETRHAVAAEAMRIASINLCADQLLMTLADPHQVTSLGPFARNRSLSFMAKQARSFAINRGSAEEIIEQRANLVFAGPFDSRLSQRILQQRGVEVFMLDEWRSVEQGIGQIRAVAAKLGQEARGQIMIAAIRAGLQALESAALAQGSPLEALILQKRGYAVYSGILAGLTQQAGLLPRRGAGAGGLLRLETIATNPADVLILTGQSRSPADQGEALLVHPALARLFPRERQIILPEQLIVCAGPSTPELLRVFTAGIRQLSRHSLKSAQPSAIRP